MTARKTTGGWTFDGFGAQFDTHVAAHLPGYLDAQNLIGIIAQYFLPPGGILADYGASTGRTAEVVAEAIRRPFTAYLYDADESMLDQARARLVPLDQVTVHTYHRKLPDRGLTGRPAADLSIALWFLQFIPPQQLVPVLRQIRDGAALSSPLIVATKMRHADSRWEEVAVGALDDYKAASGVSPQERVEKTASLRGVMYPLSLSALSGSLLASGWGQATILWRWHVWTILGAFAV